MIDPSDVSAWLAHEDGQLTGIVGICTIGRAPSNHLRLSDASVSRRHAIVHAQDSSQYWLIDLGSRNGTFLNDSRITDPVRVVNGNRIRIARIPFTFHQARETSPDRNGEITLEPTAREIEESDAWLLVADIEASTRLKQRLAPQQIAIRISEWFSACRSLIRRHGGDIDKYLGDGFLAYWLAEEGSGERVAAALKALKGAQEHPPLAFRFVLHHGRICIGNLPTMGRSRLFGPEINFVFRLERLAKDLRKSRLVSDAAFWQLGESGFGNLIGRHEIPGFDKACDLYDF